MAPDAPLTLEDALTAYRFVYLAQRNLALRTRKEYLIQAATTIKENIMRKILATAALTLAAIATTAGAASASTTYHHRTGGSVSYTYTCTQERIGHRLYDACVVKVDLTGPMGPWQISFKTPRREELANFSWQVDDSSEMGSSAPQTKYAPYVLTGYPDDWANNQIPAGVTCTGGFYFDVLADQPLPRVSFKISQ